MCIENWLKVDVGVCYPAKQRTVVDSFPSEKCLSHSINMVPTRLPCSYTTPTLALDYQFRHVCMIQTRQMGKIPSKIPGVFKFWIKIIIFFSYA